MKQSMKKILMKIATIFYPTVDLSLYSPIEILKTAFFQKVIGFNRSAPWPVHRSTTIKSIEKIDRGTRLPGFSKNCHLDGRNGIVFGENVWIGHNVTIVSMNHDTNNYHNYIKGSPIKIGKNSWIASNVTILPEVELGEHTVVAAGSIVTKSFKEGNQVIGGNPAKIIKKLKKYKG